MIVKAYQTLEDRDNIDYIETEGPFDCKRNDAWLGLGYYFWDTNMDWAIDWGEFAYTINNKEFLIASCKIDLSKDCFDLYGNVMCNQAFVEVNETLKKSDKFKGKEPPKVSEIIEYLKFKKIFPYKSIRTADMHYKKVIINFGGKRNEHTILNQRVQICVIEKKDVLLRPFSVIYPEKYLI
jgi:hypothetical protein